MRIFVKMRLLFILLVMLLIVPAALGSPNFFATYIVEGNGNQQVKVLDVLAQQVDMELHQGLILRECPRDGTFAKRGDRENEFILDWKKCPMKRNVDTIRLVLLYSREGEPVGTALHTVLVDYHGQKTMKQQNFINLGLNLQGPKESHEKAVAVEETHQQQAKEEEEGAEQKQEKEVKAEVKMETTAEGNVKQDQPILEADNGPSGQQPMNVVGIPHGNEEKLEQKPVQNEGTPLQLPIKGNEPPEGTTAAITDGAAALSPLLTEGEAKTEPKKDDQQLLVDDPLKNEVAKEGPATESVDDKAINGEGHQPAVAMPEEESPSTKMP